MTKTVGKKIRKPTKQGEHCCDEEERLVKTADKKARKPTKQDENSDDEEKPVKTANKKIRKITKQDEDSDDEEKPVKTAGKNTRKPTKHDEDGDDEEEKPVKTTGKKTRKPTKQDGDSDDEEEKPVKTAGKKTRKPTKQDGDGDDEEEKPVKTTGKKVRKPNKQDKDNNDTKKPIRSEKAEASNNANKSKRKNNKVLEVKTTQTGAFKQVIERISNIISDCCIVFIPPDRVSQNSMDDDYYEEVEDDNQKSLVPKNKKGSLKANAKPSNKKKSGGIRILRLTEDKSILIKLNLDAGNFEYFRCDEPKITIGVDMHNLRELLKMVNDDDPIVLYMNHNNRSILYIRSLNENNDSSEETDIEVYLMELANPDMPIPKTEFQNHITMASDKFHNICKHLNNNSVHVEITTINNEISFRGKNEGGKVTMSYKDINETGKKKDKPDQVVQGHFELRSLMVFSKCNKLTNIIDIYLRNDFPLVLVISVVSLGKMYVFLSPIEHPNA